MRVGTIFSAALTLAAYTMGGTRQPCSIFLTPTYMDLEQSLLRRTVRKSLPQQLSPSPIHSVVRIRIQCCRILVLNAVADVVNGEKNTLTVTVENKSSKNVTLLNIAGALVHPDTNALLKNVRIRATRCSSEVHFVPFAVDQSEIWRHSP